MMQAILDSPLLGLGLSAATFALGRWIQKKTGWTIANPLLISAVLSISLLLLLEIPYEAYAQGGEFINLMLSPVTAILALGIYNQRAVLKRYFVPVLVGCLVGSASSVLSVLGLCRLFGLDAAITAALIPKSCTTAHRPGHRRGQGRNCGHHGSLRDLHRPGGRPGRAVLCQGLPHHRPGGAGTGRGAHAATPWAPPKPGKWANSRAP